MTFVGSIPTKQHRQNAHYHLCGHAFANCPLQGQTSTRNANTALQSPFRLKQIHFKSIYIINNSKPVKEKSNHFKESKQYSVI